LNREFWTGGAAGELRIQRCPECQAWQHPPRARCRICARAELTYQAVSGLGTVYTFSVIRHPYRSGIPLPVVMALVELPEQPGLRITTNITGCEPERIEIGLPVRVVFEDQGNGTFVPLFEPVTSQPKEHEDD
jgi:uncharacterized OB-fold protein